MSFLTFFQFKSLNRTVQQPDVCQIRLDFLQFQLGDYKYGPVSDSPPGDPSVLASFGSCINDKLMISPTQNLPDGIVLCGSAGSTTQHRKRLTAKRGSHGVSQKAVNSFFSILALWGPGEDYAEPHSDEHGKYDERQSNHD